jgi:hypothetical protein
MFPPGGFFEADGAGAGAEVDFHSENSSLSQVASTFILPSSFLTAPYGGMNQLVTATAFL